MFSMAAFHFQMLDLGPLIFCRPKKLKAGLLSLEVFNPCRNSRKQCAAVLMAPSNNTKPQSQLRSSVWCEAGQRSSSSSCSVHLQPGAVRIPLGTQLVPLCCALLCQAPAPLCWCVLCVICSHLSTSSCWVWCGQQLRCSQCWAGQPSSAAAFVLPGQGPLACNKKCTTVIVCAFLYCTMGKVTPYSCIFQKNGEFVNLSNNEF